MYFGVAKITFEAEDSPAGSNSENKAANQLCESLRSKLKVCAKPCSKANNGIPAIAVSALASSEIAMDELLDSILDMCDGKNLGRIDSEFSVVEHINVLEEEDEEDQ
jgi:hypothetical protein